MEKELESAARNGLKDSLIGNTSHVNDSQNYTFENIATFKTLYKHSLTIRRSGCSALDLAYVAAGRLGWILGQWPWIWDVAAGMLIAEEAGALTSDFLGNPDYKKAIITLCATPKCFKQMLEAIKPNFTAH